ncbi:MAG TPA: hypothetical protein VNN08_03275 [Thermoanaerobaculia bacterium]|nr:hypothetical protein [Thermoanaerobaculia bacterium]
MDTSQVQIVVWCLTLVVGGIGAYKGIRELRMSTEARTTELRWKQAAVARDLLSEIHHGFYSSSAVQMFDWWCCTRCYTVKHDGIVLVPDAGENGLIEIATDDVRAALSRPTHQQIGEKEIFIRDCFDWFFYYVDRIDQYVLNGLVTIEDVAAVFNPYSKLVSGERALFEGFMKQHEYHYAVHFFRRDLPSYLPSLDS